MYKALGQIIRIKKNKTKKKDLLKYICNTKGFSAMLLPKSVFSETKSYASSMDLTAITDVFVEICTCKCVYALYVFL